MIDCLQKDYKQLIYKSLENKRKITLIYELCQNTRDFSREMNGIFFVYKKFEIVKYIWYNKNGDK